MNTPLSNKQVEDFLISVSTKVFLYQKLDDYKSIEELFGTSDNFVILYTDEELNEGHFCAFINHGKFIEYFDSSAASPNPDYHNIAFSKTEEGKKQSHMNRLLKASGVKTILHNNTALQEDSSAVCGKWCAARILSGPTPLCEFIALFSNHKKLDPDQMVNMLYRFAK